MEQSIRLGSVIKFDDYKEKDILNAVKELTAQHKLGLYIENMLRYIWDNPEKFKGTKVDPSIYGVKTSRKAFFSQVAKEVQECRNAVNQLYNEMILLSTAAKVGQTFGLVENTSDYLLGLECIEKYTERIRKELGMVGTLYEHGKMSKAEEVANQAADILVKMMLAKNVDLRIKQSGEQASTVKVPITNTDNAVKNNTTEDIHSVTDNIEEKAEQSKTVAIEKQESPMEQVDDKQDNININMEENTGAVSDEESNSDGIDLMAAFCGLA